MGVVCLSVSIHSLEMPASAISTRSWPKPQLIMKYAAANVATRTPCHNILFDPVQCVCFVRHWQRQTLSCCGHKCLQNGTLWGGLLEPQCVHSQPSQKTPHTHNEARPVHFHHPRGDRSRGGICTGPWALLTLGHLQGPLRCFPFLIYIYRNNSARAPRSPWVPDRANN